MSDKTKLQSIFEALIANFLIGCKINIGDVDKAFLEKIENPDEWWASIKNDDSQAANFKSDVERAVQEYLAEQARLTK